MKKVTNGVAWGFLFALFVSLAHPVEAQTQSGNCRFGITVPHSVEGYDLKSLGVGSYLDWRQSPTTNAPKNIEYVHVIRLRNGARQFIYDTQFPKAQTEFEASLKQDVTTHLRGIWLVGNEPDTNFEVQDSVSPQEYALAYHNIYELIKSIDPASQIGIGTIVQPTPLRLIWLDKMFAAHQARYGVAPPSDFWSIHSFILREKVNDWGAGVPPGLNEVSGELSSLDDTNNINIFKLRLYRFRQWMADRGQRDKPLWITEYGSLLPHDGREGFVTQPMTRARDYMISTFDVLRTASDDTTGYPRDGNKLVQRWYWYSLNDELSHFGGSLYDPKTKQQTIIGEAYVNYIAKLPVSPDLKISSAKLNEQSTNGLLNTRVMLINYGDAATSKPITVTFFNDHPSNGQLLGSAIIVARPLAGCGYAEIVSAALPKPNGDSGRVYVKIESEEIKEPQVMLVGMWKER